MSSQPQRLPGDMQRRALSETDLEIERLHKEGVGLAEIARRLDLFGGQEVRRRLDKVRDIRMMEAMTMATDSPKCFICNKPIPPRPYQDEKARACSPGCAKELAYREFPDLGPTGGKRVAEEAT